MGSLKERDGNIPSRYFKANGTGNEGDPYSPIQDVNILGVDGNALSVQNPIPVDGDSIYAKDISVTGSDVGTFTGTITDLVDDLDSTFSSTGHSSPANFTIKLERPITNIGIKFCSPVSKNFSNVKLTLKDKSGSTLVVIDDSSNDTDYSSNEYFWTQTTWCSILVEFYTTDDIDINYMILEKSVLTHVNVKYVDPGNTSSTPLPADTGGSDHIWTGDWISTKDYVQSVVIVITDQNAAQDGLRLEVSNDGINPVHIHSFSPLINIPFGHHYPGTLEGKFFRVKYINGTDAQSTFDISTTLFNTAVEEGHVHDLGASLDDDHPAPIVRSVITGKRPDGTYANVSVTDDSALLVEQNAHTLPELSVHMTLATGISDTLGVAADKNDQVITVVSGTQWSAGNKIQILDGPNTEYDIFKVLSVDTNDLTLDRELDAGHPIGESIIGQSVNMAVNGSATPVIFNYTPRSDQVVHIHTLNITMSSSTEPGLERFGGMVSLSKGAHFRVKNVTGRDNTYWIPFRSNNSLVLSGFNYVKEPKLAATWFLHMKINIFEENASVIELDGTAGQSFEVILQDDLTDLATMEVKLGLHEEPH